MIKKKNIQKIFILFLIFHIALWTIAPTITNTNLPLDTVEALAWGSNLNWGFDKHPPLSAFVVEVFYKIFGSSDWAYYLLSQIFVVIAFIYVWKFSRIIFNDKIYSLLSVFTLSSIYYYNFTTPEFNVNIAQLPFWAMSVYYFWVSLKFNKKLDWVLFGIVSALGFLSKYLFIYLLIAFFIYFIYNFTSHKKFLINYILSILISLLILIPHFVWLIDNDFVTISYGLSRSSLVETELIDHLKNPVSFIIKQILILIPFIILVSFLIKKLKLSFRMIDEKKLFLISINLIPLFLVLFTSILTGAKIRTMWMTPFYLFLGIFIIEMLRKNIDLKNIKRFYYLCLFYFLLSPISYSGISIYDKTKRTDYPGKEISRLVQNKWDENFLNEIKIVIGDEWYAGNLSYHLSSRPVWIKDLKNDTSVISENIGVVYTGNPQILKKICPGVFGTIKPVGYCMIGKR